jgi:hypothetical protein
MPNEQTSVPLFTAGEVLTAADMNISAGTGVPVFTNSTTRDAAFGGAGEKVLAEGQLCYLSDTNIVQYYTGAAWASVGATDWAAWTPTWTNLTVGNATQTARYSQSGKTVFFTLKLVFGSTTSMGTQPTFTWPVTAASTEAAQGAVTKVLFLDASAQIVLGATDPRSSTTSLTKLNAPSGTVQLQDQDRAVTSTVPFTWTTSDTIWVMGSYEGA